MSFIFKDRSLIPNWRDFNKTVAMGELNAHVSPEIGRNFSQIDPYIIQWENNKTIAHAGDLISNAYVIGLKHNKFVVDAANFVLRQDDAPISLKIASRKIIQPNDGDDVNLLDFDSIEDYKNLLDGSFFSKQIRNIKNILKSQEKNAIRWVELSRLYSMVGRYDKAEKSMLIAVGLSDNNRYVLRSATRLFCHIDNTDKAIYYLKKQSNTVLDPWLLSAEISSHRLINKTSKNIKKGLQLIQSNKFNNADFSELACALGTEEFVNGTKKDSKTLLRKSLLKPNDNTLAQVEFLSTLDISYAFDVDFSAVKNPFEAKATEAFSRHDWKEALIYAQKWLLDMPFSKRAPIFGSFVASLFTEDYDLSEKFCLLGLYSNPRDVTVLNNLIYTYAMQNKVSEATRYLRQLLSFSLNLGNNEKIVLGATIGLVKFREGDAKTGRYFYHNSIDLAKKNNLEYYALLAQIHLLNEEISLNEIDYNSLLQSTEKLAKKVNYIATNTLWEKTTGRLNPKNIILKL